MSPACRRAAQANVAANPVMGVASQRSRQESCSFLVRHTACRCNARTVSTCSGHDERTDGKARDGPVRENTGGKPDMVAEVLPPTRVDAPPIQRGARENIVTQRQPNL